MRGRVQTLSLIAALGAGLGVARGGEPLLGGWSEVSVTNREVIAAAQCAVRARNRLLEGGPAATNSLSLLRIKAAKQQVVAGLNLSLVMEVRIGAERREAEAVVWHRLSGEYELTTWSWPGIPPLGPPTVPQ